MKNKKQKRSYASAVYLQMKRKSTKVERSTNLLLDNLIKTNTHLLRTLDVSSSVLF